MRATMLSPIRSETEASTVRRLSVEALATLARDPHVDPGFRLRLGDPEKQVDRARTALSAQLDREFVLFRAVLKIMGDLTFAEMQEAGAVVEVLDFLLYQRDPLRWLEKARPEREAAWWAAVQSRLPEWLRSADFKRGPAALRSAGIVPGANGSAA